MANPTRGTIETTQNDDIRIIYLNDFINKSSILDKCDEIRRNLACFKSIFRGKPIDMHTLTLIIMIISIVILCRCFRCTDVEYEDIYDFDYLRGMFVFCHFCVRSSKCLCLCQMRLTRLFLFALNVLLSVIRLKCPSSFLIQVYFKFTSLSPFVIELSYIQPETVN